jgi:hypothetical protein
MNHNAYPTKPLPNYGMQYCLYKHGVTTTMLTSPNPTRSIAWTRKTFEFEIILKFRFSFVCLCWQRYQI